MASGAPAAGAPAAGATEEADRARVRTIRRAIVRAGDDLRAAHPWLDASQDVIGAAFIAAAVAVNVGLALAFAAGAVGALPTLLGCALAQSVLHEVEHDLIHSLYFRRCGPAAVNAALACVYACRLSTLNPWSRRRLHLHHHSASGTASDLEERAITNGLPWTPLRLLVTGDNLLCVLLRPAASLRELRDYIRAMPEADPRVNPAGHLAARAAILADSAGGYLPGGLVHYGRWYAFLADAACALAGCGGFLRAAAGPGGAACVTAYAAAFGAPNLLRTFCLHLVSSNIHYAGIRRGDILNQTQVLTHPLFWPANAFCCNFGGTHAIHHFVVRDPFYIRQAISRRVLPVMRAQGVRFNDVGTFWRANRVPGGDAAAGARAAKAA
jgi:fatty acid desaturase